MLTAYLALIALAAPQDGAPTDSPAVLVGRMLAYYNDAKSMTGRISLTQSGGGASGTVETFLQFEAPSKLYIRQEKSVGEKRVFTVISNGVRFAYDSPVGDGKRLIEAVKPADGLAFDYRQIYAAASSSIPDRSTPLDIAIGRREDLTYLRNQWKTVTYKGTTNYGDETVHVISGEWRPYGEAATEGEFRMYITADGQLRQFALSQTVRPKGAAQSIQVLSTWNVKLTKNGKPDPALFGTVR